MTDGGQQRATELGVELEAKLVAALVAEWRRLNYSLFKSALRPPVIRIEDQGDPLARYDPQHHSLVLARELVLGRAWAEVVESLERLAVEQFVHERLRVDEHRRGPTYRRICVRLGIHPVPLDARAPGPAAGDELGAGAERPAAAGKRLARVRKLLALAGSPNLHEAETAALMAQRLLLELNRDHAQLGDRVELDPSPEEARGYGHRQLGPGRARLTEHDHRLAKILAEHFFVETAWVPIYLPRRGVRAMVLEVCGLDFNLAMAAHVHGFLRATAGRLWVEYCQQHGRDLADASARAAYLAGVLQGFEAKLADQQQALAERGLVWVPGPGLSDYFRRRHPRLRGAGGWATAHGAEGRELFGHGHAAGRRIVLAPPLAPNDSGARRALAPGCNTD
jgi:hypothetical protein